jgi:TolB protein
MEQAVSPSRRTLNPLNRPRVLFALGLLVATNVATVRSQAPVDPTLVFHGVAAPRLAIPDCVPRAGDPASREACRIITQVLRRDLKFENLFQFVPENLMASLPPLNPEAPNLESWKSVGANVLVITRAQVTGSEIVVDVRLHSVDTGQSMTSKRYAGRADNPRIFAHEASDEIVALSNNKGVARTKIVFVSDRDATPSKRAKELYIVDYDGFNARRVTANRSLNILPTWRPDGRALAYVSFRTGMPDLFLASIFEGKSANLTGGQGQTLACSFSPDGKRIAYASSRNGNVDVWVSNADGTGAKRLTTSVGKDTAPTWSPTGQEIAFTSDRGGTPQIYVMDNEGLNVRRLSTVGSYNDAPAWNPSKEFSEIAYTSRLEGRFQVAVVDLGSQQVRQVTEGQGSCEYPSWAPSGRHLTFTCKRGKTLQLAVSDRQGRSVEVLAVGSGNNEQPDWGPPPGS